jgi:hypothetical protein
MTLHFSLIERFLMWIPGKKLFLFFSTVVRSLFRNFSPEIFDRVFFSSSFQIEWQAFCIFCSMSKDSWDTLKNASTELKLQNCVQAVRRQLKWSFSAKRARLVGSFATQLLKSFSFHFCWAKLYHRMHLLPPPQKKRVNCWICHFHNLSIMYCPEYIYLIGSNHAQSAIHCK